MEEDIRDALRSIQQAQSAQRQEIDALANSLRRLVVELEADDRREERDEAREERARDKLLEQLEDVKKRIENVGASLRELPDRLLNTIEKKIYELRVARWEALQAGVSNEPAPLPPVPVRRDPTGRHTALQPIVEDDDDGKALTAGQQRRIRAFLSRHWSWFRWTVAPIALEAIHRGWDVLKHAFGR